MTEPNQNGPNFLVAGWFAVCRTIFDSEYIQQYTKYQRRSGGVLGNTRGAVLFPGVSYKARNWLASQGHLPFLSYLFLFISQVECVKSGFPDAA